MHDLDVFERGVTDARRDELIGKIAGKVVSMGLTAPAILFLESTKPLSFIGSQAMVFFQPIVKTFFSFTEYDEVAVMLEERQNIERLIQAIEKADAER